VVEMSLRLLAHFSWETPSAKSTGTKAAARSRGPTAKFSSIKGQWMHNRKGTSLAAMPRYQI
jgi:hypothetical protein